MNSSGILVLKEDCSDTCHYKINNTFQCISGHIISILSVCDGVLNCGQNDKSDESICSCTHDTNIKNTCRLICDKSDSCKCSIMYYRTHDGKCHQYIQQSNIFGNTNSGRNFTCESQILDIALMNDLVSDCGESADDEHTLKDVLINHNAHECPKPSQISCRTGHNSCFDVTDICVYRLNSFKHLIPCRTGEHMEDCTDFECNLKYKCPGYYCIPFSYLCDGKWDCPDVSDERKKHNCGYNRKCKNMFHCSSSQICVHFEDVCDGFMDCPLQDDEFVCTLKYVSCPMNCKCHEIIWRESTACLFIFGLSFLFSTVSPFTLLFMSVSRLMVVLHPLDTDFKETSFVRKCVFVPLAILLTLSSLVVLMYKIFFNKLPTTLCLPFIDPTDTIWFVKFLTVLVFVVQVICSLVIGVMYVKLVRHLQKKEKSIRKSKSHSNTGLIVQLIVITSSNMLCWIPSGILYLTSLFVSRYPTDMLIWTAITATPINSIINPIVFLVTSIRKHLSENVKK